MNSYYLYTETQTKWNHGAAKYRADVEHGFGNINIAISMSFLQEGPRFSAYLDTGCTWVVVSKEILLSCGIEVDEDSIVRQEMSTRFGKFTGFINRIPIYIFAEFGKTIKIDATCLVCKDWNGPIVIGWKGCLERFRFAIDPANNMFLFGQL